MDQSRPPAAATALGNIAFACFAGFAVLLLLLHALRPDYTPIDHMISDYAVGRFGWVMTIAFSALALGCFTLMLGLVMAGPRRVTARIAEVFLTIVTAGLVVTALFHTDLETAKTTQAGNIHTLSFLVNVVGILLASIFLAISLRTDPRWRSYFPIAAVFAVLLIAAFVAQFLTLHVGKPYGITNRIFVAVLILWLGTTAWRLRSLKA